MFTATEIIQLYVFLLAGFVGFQVITRVPKLLHTPLMSATNAISAISIVGAIVVVVTSHNTITTILGTVAVAAAVTNIVGGYMITVRMLRMFKQEKRKKS
jgi:NAD(P) transhydrogenase subunit alpha